MLCFLRRACHKLSVLAADIRHVAVSAVTGMRAGEGGGLRAFVRPNRGALWQLFFGSLGMV